MMGGDHFDPGDPWLTAYSGYVRRAVNPPNQAYPLGSTPIITVTQPNPYTMIHPLRFLFPINPTITPNQLQLYRAYSYSDDQGAQSNIAGSATSSTELTSVDLNRDIFNASASDGRHLVAIEIGVSNTTAGSVTANFGQFELLALLTPRGIGPAPA